MAGDARQSLNTPGVTDSNTYTVSSAGNYLTLTTMDWQVPPTATCIPASGSALLQTYPNLAVPYGGMSNTMKKWHWALGTIGTIIILILSLFLLQGAGERSVSDFYIIPAGSVSLFHELGCPDGTECDR